MYTSILSLSLLMAPIANTTPAWQPSYRVAMENGQRHGKPVVVFVGSGPKGLAQITTEGKLSEETYQLLAQQYVCVYLDRTNGQAQLAQDFGITQGSGIVISDRSGSFQAFHHDGRLGQSELNRRLRQYADPDVVVSRTESNVPSARISYYSEPAPRATYTPQVYAPSFRSVNC